jgi:hypothetical protein
VKGVNEASGLRVVDHFGECVIKLVHVVNEVSVLGVELVHRTNSGDGKCQHSLDGVRLDDGAKSLVIVHPEDLDEPSENPMSLVPV